MGKTIDELQGEVTDLLCAVRDLKDCVEVAESMYDDSMCQVDELMSALREAILVTTRVVRVPSKSKNIFASPDYDWTDATRRLACLCGLDLSEIDPNSYGESRGKGDGERKSRSRTIFNGRRRSSPAVEGQDQGSLA